MATRNTKKLSNKSKYAKYKRKSMKNRIQKMNEARETICCAIEKPTYFYMPEFPFYNKRWFGMDFCREFLKLYILTPVLMEEFIPQSKCPHIYIPSILMSELDKAYLAPGRLRQAQHEREEIESAESIIEYYLKTHPEARRATTAKSRTLPFCIGSPALFIPHTNERTFDGSVIEIVVSTDSAKLKSILARKDLKTEKHFLACLSIFRSKRGKIIAVLREREPFEREIFLGEVTYECQKDYLASSMIQLSRKYFRNIIIPYLGESLQAPLEPKEKIYMTTWFVKRIIQYAKYGFADLIISHSDLDKRKVVESEAVCIKEFSAAT